MFVVPLAADNVWLSPPVVTDIDEICAACSDASIAEWTTMPAPYGRSDAEQFVRQTVPSGWADRSPTWRCANARTVPCWG